MQHDEVEFCRKTYFESRSNSTIVCQGRLISGAISGEDENFPIWQFFLSKDFQCEHRERPLALVTLRPPEGTLRWHQNCSLVNILRAVLTCTRCSARSKNFIHILDFQVSEVRHPRLYSVFQLPLKSEATLCILKSKKIISSYILLSTVLHSNNPLL